MPPPRTGTTTVSGILTAAFEARVYRHWEAPNVKPWKHAIHLPKDLEDYFVFATVRNPYARVISQFGWWKAHGKTQKRFRQFLKEFLPRPVSSLYCQLHQQPGYKPPEGCVPVRIDAMVKLENLSEDLHRLPFVSRPVAVPRLNRKERRFDPVKYTRETADWVLRYRRDDFQFGGYPLRCPPDLLRE